MKNIIVLLLCLSASFSIVYPAVSRYDINHRAVKEDVTNYIKIYKGEALSSIPERHRYRVLTPHLARLVPFLPEFVARYYEIDSEKIIKFKFCVVNMFGLVAAGFLLFLFCQALRFSYMESILGIFLFYTSFVVINYGGIPMADSLAHFFLILGILSAFRNWNIMLLLSFGIGMFAKETCILILFFIIFMNHSFKSKLTKLALCLPGIMAYLIFRSAFPSHFGVIIFDFISTAKMFSKLWLYIIIDIGLSFGVIWLLALKGFLLVRKEKHIPLYRLSFTMFPIGIVPFLSGTNFGRIWFLAFPVMIPLALMGIRHYRNKEIGA